MVHVINMFNTNSAIHMCIYIILQCPLAKCALVKYVTQVPILLLCLIIKLNCVITSYNKVICTCVTYLTISDTTKNTGVGPISIQIPGIGAAPLISLGAYII